MPFPECHRENEIKPRDPIRCRECGYRIMYKKRTKRCILFKYLMFRFTAHYRPQVSSQHNMAMDSHPDHYASQILVCMLHTPLRTLR